jgi:hypothetical protein
MEAENQKMMTQAHSRVQFDITIHHPHLASHPHPAKVLRNFTFFVFYTSLQRSISFAQNTNSLVDNSME